MNYFYPLPQLVGFMAIHNLGCVVVKRSWTVGSLECVGYEGVDHTGLASPVGPHKHHLQIDRVRHVGRTFHFCLDSGVMNVHN